MNTFVEFEKTFNMTLLLTHQFCLSIDPVEDDVKNVMGTLMFGNVEGYVAWTDWSGRVGGQAGWVDEAGKKTHL